MPKRRYDNDADAFDANGVLRDGRSVRVPMWLMDMGDGGVDDVQRSVAVDAAVRKYGLYPAGAGAKEGGSCTIDGRPGKLRAVEGGFVCVPDDDDTEDAMLHIKTDAPTVLTDALGRSDPASLSRPGLRYLVAGHKTADHVQQVTREVMRDEARREAVVDASSAWRGGAGDRTIPVKRETGDAVADAWLDGIEDLTSAWSGGTRSVR
jgi:hypothetical protein